MENRKKLPLPAGEKTSKSPKNAYAIMLLGVALLAGIAGYYIFFAEKDATSSKAFLSGSFIEIHVLSPGSIEYIAKTGQPVEAGETVLKMATAIYEKAAKEAEAVVSDKAGAVPQRSRDLMLRYLAIPQSEAELSEYVRQAAASEKTAKDALNDFTGRQAVFGLELRKLELKHNKLPEEESRMEAMRVEEELLRASHQEAIERFETASLERAATEKRLKSKRELGRSLRSLPATQREQLYALEKEFFKIYEAEQQIALASVSSPKNGKVMFAAMAVGDNAQEGDTALYIIPEGKPDVWVTAYFNPKEAKKMRLGAPCTVAIENFQGTILKGILAERLPYLETEQSGEVPFKVVLDNLDASRLIGLTPRHAMLVKVDK